MAFTIALPRAPRRPRPRLLTILAVVVALAVVGAYELGAPRFLSSAGLLPQSPPRPPTARISLEEPIAGQPIHGVITLTGSDAFAELGPAEVAIFPAGARRVGVAEESVRARLLTIDVGRRIGSGATRRVEFVWDLRLDDGRPAPPGNYVAIARVRSHTTAGQGQTTAMGLTNEVTFTLR